MNLMGRLGTIPSTPMMQDGNRTNYVCYGANGSAYFGTNYTYDESGNMVQMENWDLQKKTVTYIQYE